MVLKLLNPSINIVKIAASPSLSSQPIIDFNFYVWGRAQTSRFLVSHLLAKFFELLFCNCQYIATKEVIV